MKTTGKEKEMEGQPAKRRFNFSISSLIGIAVVGFIVYQLIGGFSPAVKEITYSSFKTALNTGQISSVLVSVTDSSGKMKDGTTFTTIRVDDTDLTKTLEAVSYTHLR